MIIALFRQKVNRLGNKFENPRKNKTALCVKRTVFEIGYSAYPINSMVFIIARYPPDTVVKVIVLFVVVSTSIAVYAPLLDKVVISFVVPFIVTFAVFAL